MEVNATLKYLRTSPKKVRLVVDVIRGMKVEEALLQLEHMNKAAVRPIQKLLNSAIANATNNFDLAKDNLYIKTITVDSAGMLKRWRPRAFGRASMIRKRMSHVKLVLEELVPTKGKVKGKKPEKQEAVVVKDKNEIEHKERVEKDIPVQKQEQAVGKDIEQEKGQEIHDPRMEGKHRHPQHQDKKNMKKGGGFMKKVFSRKSGS